MLKWEKAMQRQWVETPKKEKVKIVINKLRIDFSWETHRFMNIENYLETFKEKYPAVDVKAEVKKAEAWLMSNPKNRKSDYLRFLNKWLSRSQDKAPKIEKRSWEE